MRYVNNYREAIELAAGATNAALSLPDGEYRLTLTNAEGDRWEIVDATVAAGAATLVRAQEGTAAQDWPAGSTIYCAVTAEQLNNMGESGGGTSVSEGAPTAAPPQAGALHVSTGIYSERAYAAVGTRGPEDWLPLSPLPVMNFYVADQFNVTYGVERSAKEIGVYTPFEQTGEFGITLQLPAWEASPLGFSILIEPGPSASVVTRLDFSEVVPSGWAFTGEAYDYSSGATLELDGSILSITTASSVVVSRLALDRGDGSSGLWFSLDIRPAAAPATPVPLGWE